MSPWRGGYQHTPSWFPSVENTVRREQDKGHSNNDADPALLSHPYSPQSIFPHSPSLPEASPSPCAHVSLPGMLFALSTTMSCSVSQLRCCHLKWIFLTTLPSGVPYASPGFPQIQSTLSEGLVGGTGLFICLLPVESRLRTGRSGFQP